MKLFEDGAISRNQVDKFYDSVREFHTTAIAYCTRWLPLDDPLLKNCVFIDFKHRNDCSMDNIEEVLSALDHILGELINDPKAVDDLEEDFLVYQSMSDTDIPAHVWDE